MAAHIGLLRAINLGAHNRVSMADLRELLARLGLKDSQTLLQSGNVVFDGGTRSNDQLETILQDGTRKHLGVDTAYFVRTAKEWQAIIKANPFPKEARLDPGHTILMCLKTAPGPAAVKALQDAIKDREVVRAKGPQAYFLYPDGMGRSRLTTTLIEKKLATPGTARNWNTVLKLGALTEKS